MSASEEALPVEKEEKSDKTNVTVVPTATVQSKPKIRGRKNTPQLPIIERRNWLIHRHFVRKEYDTCKSLIQEQLKETRGQCEYAIYIQAMIMRNEGDIQNSLELFQACHLLNSKNPDNLKQVAKNLILLGKHKGALECYNHAAELGEKDWDICHCLGVCYQFLKQYDKAEASYQEALSRNRHIVTYSALSKLYLEKDEPEKAMSLLQKAVEFSPENTELLTSLGLLHLRKNNFHRAFELLGQALTFDPENYKAILAAGSLMQKHGDYDVALTKYRVAAQKVPESASLWNNIAMCFFGKKKYVAAISCLKRANYLSPFDWRILYNLGLLHLTMEQYASAFQFTSSALTLKPDHGPLFTLLAVALTNLEQTENAERAYEQAAKLNPTDHHTMINFCVFLHNQNRSKEAGKVLRKFYKNLPTEKNANLDKEMLDVGKKLSAALNVGDKLVAEKEKASKKKRQKDGSKTAPSTSKDTATSRADDDAEGSRGPALKSTDLPPLSSSKPANLPKLPPLSTSSSRGVEGDLPKRDDFTSGQPTMDRPKTKNKPALLAE
ncbi:BBSome complex member BBS4-like isoform X1 [Clavelina lepadiformis]|uniref:BBSome complex member BBS4-like isoform X1 n=1 Tax=Clavelina lepadiformis TaxID=159417 RepID=UPI004042BBB3